MQLLILQYLDCSFLSLIELLKSRQKDHPDLLKLLRLFSSISKSLQSFRSINKSLIGKSCLLGLRKNLFILNYLFDVKMVHQVLNCNSQKKIEERYPPKIIVMIQGLLPLRIQKVPIKMKQFHNQTIRLMLHLNVSKVLNINCIYSQSIQNIVT